ncbi:MAG: thiamine-phosphate kinase [Gammaproteobacteria bacterium]
MSEIAPTVADIGERALIRRISARLVSPSWVVVGPGDDAAVVEPERRTLDVLTTDALVESVHFDRRFCPPDALGHKALAVTLSDLAAMGAAPRAALLSLALPDAFPVADVDRVLDGLLALADRWAVALIGGNITRSPGPLVIDVTALGSVGPRRVLTRAGARAGDDVYVTGTLGGGAAGLQAFREGAKMPGAQERYLRPDPRVRAGVLLGRNRAATACMDLSDGLADGLRQVAEASGVGIAIEAGAVPIEGAVMRWFAQHGADPAVAAVAGGDDYELLFTSRPAWRGRLRAVRGHLSDLPITRIGVVTKERTVVLRTRDGERAVPEGFEHFR